MMLKSRSGSPDASFTEAKELDRTSARKKKFSQSRSSEQFRKKYNPNNVFSKNANMHNFENEKTKTKRLLKYHYSFFLSFLFSFFLQNGPATAAPLQEGRFWKRSETKKEGRLFEKENNGNAETER